MLVVPQEPTIQQIVNILNDLIDRLEDLEVKVKDIQNEIK